MTSLHKEYEIQSRALAYINDAMPRPKYYFNPDYAVWKRVHGRMMERFAQLKAELGIYPSKSA